MNQRKKSHWIACTSFLLFLLLIAYPLSFGPMVFIREKLHRVVSRPALQLFESGMNAFYYPVTEGPRLFFDPAPDIFKCYGIWWGIAAQK